MDFNLSVGKITVLAAVACAVLFGTCSIGSIVETNQAGFAQVLQVPVSGELEVFTTPGMFWQKFGTVTEYRIAGTYRFAVEEASDSAYSTPIIVRFSDNGTAGVSGNVRFDLPTSPENILQIHTKFRSYEHLVESLIKPAVAETLVVSGSLMTAEESYSGRRAEFAQLAWDQALNGVYLTEWERTEKVDPLTGEKATARVVRIKTDKDGKPLRKQNPLNEYGIIISQFILDKDFDYEEGVREQMKTQRDAMQKTVTARAEAIKAEQDRVTAEATGRANVMEAKYKAEVSKETAVVDAQKALEVAKTDAQRKLEVARLEKQAAEETKQQQILLGQGEAERRRLNLAADGALAQKLATYQAVQAKWAEAFAQRRVPTTVFGVGGGGNGSDMDASTFMNILTMQAGKELAVDPTPGKQ